MADQTADEAKAKDVAAKKAADEATKKAAEDAAKKVADEAAKKAAAEAAKKAKRPELKFACVVYVGTRSFQPGETVPADIDEATIGELKAKLLIG